MNTEQFLLEVIDVTKAELLSKEASTRLSRELAKRILALGKTPAARAAAIEKNPRSIRLLQQAQEGVRQGKIKDFSRRRLGSIVGGEQGARSSGAALHSHPEGGLAVGKGTGQAVRHGRKVKITQPEALEAMRNEVAGGSIMTRAVKEDARKNPTAWRPKVVKTYGSDTGQSMTGKAVLEVGKRHKFPYPKTTMKVDLSDPLVRARIMGGTKTYKSKSGKLLKRKPDKAFKEELEDLAETAKEEGKVLGRISKKKKPEPMVFSEYVSYGKGGLNPGDAKRVSDYLLRIEKDQGVKWFDPHQGNIRYKGVGGKRKKPALFDFGVATKSKRPATMNLPDLGRIMTAVPSNSPEFQQFLAVADRQKFIDLMRKAKT
tara:strand:- start:2876 stop:3994 length:1119 start_codon:yes stop_codon:yes gene_type:complete